MRECGGCFDLTRPLKFSPSQYKTILLSHHSCVHCSSTFNLLHKLFISIRNLANLQKRPSFHIISASDMPFLLSWASQVAQMVKNLSVIWETWVQSLGGKIPWRRERLLTPVFWPGESHGLYSPWGRKELDMTKRHLFCSLELL